MAYGPFVVILSQGLPNGARAVCVRDVRTHGEALSMARLFVLEKKPYELRCDPARDNVSIFNLDGDEKKDLLTMTQCDTWRRESNYDYRRYYGDLPKAAPLNTRLDLDESEVLKVVDFRND